MLRISLLLAALTLPPPAAAQAAAQRIVSINLCTDQLLLMLAEPGQIASVSHLAGDPAHSFMAAEAKDIPKNHGELEELLHLQADLILAHTFSPPVLLRRLRSMGLAVEQVPEAVDLEGIRAGIRQLARRVGSEERGEALIDRMDREIAEATADLPMEETPPRALFYHPNGYTNGSGTLQDTALRLAGWQNAAAESGLQGFAPLDLEALVRLSPLQLFTSGSSTDDSRCNDRPACGSGLQPRPAEPGSSSEVAAASRSHNDSAPASAAERLLAHPVVVRAGGDRPPVEIDYRHWICGGPMIAGAVRRLAAAHGYARDAISSRDGISPTHRRE